MRFVAVLCALAAVLAGVPAAALATVLAVPAALADEAPAWDERGEAVLSSAEALEALALLPDDNPAPVSWAEGGSRTGWFGESWEDVDGDGCDTRNEILARDLTNADYSRAAGIQTVEQGVGEGAGVCPNATVWFGTLHDPYTGATITFTRGADTSAEVQIDHVVALNYLYAHGAWAWDARRRLLVANDPLNLLAVDGQANQDKGACGPATCPVGSTGTNSWNPSGGSGWWPEDDGYRCTYAARFVSVLAAYEVGVPEADTAALREVLEDCVAGGDGAGSALGEAERVVGAVGHGLTERPGLLAMAAVGAALLVVGIVPRVGRRRDLRRRRARAQRR
ncbi:MULTISPECIES: HNH endonuclease family protein [Actinomyces]|nr:MULTISPECIES: HNH endonuclease family protein [Actinomyces]